MTTKWVSQPLPSLLEVGNLLAPPSTLSLADLLKSIALRAGLLISLWPLLLGAAAQIWFRLARRPGTWAFPPLCGLLAALVFCALDRPILAGMIEIQIAGDFAAAGVQVRLGCIEAKVQVRETDPALAAAIAEVVAARSKQLETLAVAEIPEIAAARKAYKAGGKDPSRYRPSSEALLRRVAQGKGSTQSTRWSTPTT